MKPTTSFAHGRRNQRGTTAVEFAIVAALFLTLLIGVMEMGRLLFYWNTVTEATRLGARVAAVCDINDNAVKTRMTSLFPILAAADIEVAYSPGGCTVDSCEEVTVRVLPGVAVNTYIPFVPMVLDMPSFSTTLPRESLMSVVDSIPNPVCQ